MSEDTPDTLLSSPSPAATTGSEALAADPHGTAVTMPAKADELIPPDARRRKPVRPSPTIDAAPKKKRSGLKRLLLAAAVIGAGGYGASLGYDYLTFGRFLITTDDAYVGADVTIISAKVAGHITNVAVANNQTVKAGQLLASIDDGDYKLAVAAAHDKIASQDATIARIGRQIEAQAATIEQAEAQVQSAKAVQTGAQADQERAALEFDRSQKMLATSFGSQQRFEQSTADKARTAATLMSANAGVSSSQAALLGARANLQVLAAQKSEAEHVRDELSTALDKAERDLSFTQVRAPFDGYVGNKAVEIGQYAQPGARLMALIAPTTAYVDANFKETQLGSIHPGQKVDVAIDAFGEHVLDGRVESIAPATGAQFSLLPPDNATGNFTKVVQRVTVRIALPADALKDGSVRPGLSVVASVHSRDGLQQTSLFDALGFGAANAKARP
ncbi:MAG: HlyD family secretion protein [Ancalomicrobiaceae bacterium]|nr:HlyD family secretion protein [Ancalomicrobiaceae bacterium]